MTTLGPDIDYLPVQAPLLDYLTVDTEGPMGWKYPKLQEFRRFQQKRRFNLFCARGCRGQRDNLWNIFDRGNPEVP